MLIGYHTKIMCPNCTPNWYALGDSRVNFRGFGIVTVNTGLGYSVSEVRGEEVE